MRLISGVAALAAAAACMGESAGSWDLRLQPESETAAAPERAIARGDYGDADSGWWWTVGGGGGGSLNNGDASAAVFAGASTFLADDFEFSIDLTVWYLGEDDPNGDDAAALNLNPKFRWHFISEETHTVFAEAGVGMLIATEESPEGGSEFNFTPQAGAGATFPLGDGADRLVVGVNWRHISNANIFGSERNPGRDDLFVYVGVTFPF